MPRKSQMAIEPAAPSLTVDECRTILGDSVSGQSDEQIAKMLNDLEQLAAIMYDELIRVARKDVDAVRWAAYANEHPEDAC